MSEVMNTIPSEKDKIEMAERNIRTALYDYARHVRFEDLYWDPDAVSNLFLNRLARDNYASKAELRELFRKSPAWNEELDALVINGNRTHDPDPAVCDELAERICLNAGKSFSEKAYEIGIDTSIIRTIAYRLASGSMEKDYNVRFRELVEEKFPKAYTPGKKSSRVMSAIFKQLGIVDDSAGSEYQKLFAQLADELNGKQIPFKLYVSLNPAHFLTMSNPKYDSRGATLTSCHSLNSKDYPYNNGCTGYARDKYSIIVFTAADPSDPETLNNRKTSRQMFFYRPGSGVLLQSRMYNTSGGVNGATAEGDLYRDLIQREISSLENVPNLWKTCDYINNRYRIEFYSGHGFGGYCDWTYDYMCPKLSIRSDVMETVENREFTPWEIGTYGLCPYCGEEHSENFLCESCDGPEFFCDYCDEGVHDEDDLYWVYDSRGREIRVCQDCLDNYFTQCDRCGEWHHNETVCEVRTEWGIESWCEGCREDHANWCEHCETYTTEDIISVRDYDGYHTEVCESCANEDYSTCEGCGEIVHNDLIEQADNGEGGQVWACDECRDTCDECGEVYISSVLNYRNAINGRRRCTCEACTEQVENREFEYTEGEVIA